MNEWRPIAVLANVQVNGAIGNDKLAVAGISDARMGDCISTQPELKDFLSRFTDAHGVARKPSVIIAHASIAKDNLSMDMVAGFRDVISISCILEARQKTLRYGRNAGPIYSNSFSLYPWMLSPHMNRLVAITPAIEAIHRLDKFHGQTSPEIPIHEINVQSSDEGLVSLLLSRWRDRYFDAKDDWQNLALLRSLNMANAAMQLPAGTDLVFHDFGRSLGNWISAFEILIHPGKDGTASKQKVFELLDKIVWNSEKINSEIFATPDRFKGNVDLPLAKHIYGQLYYLRNQFLHGNPVSSDQLYFPNKLPVLNFAAPLYRMALAAFLGQIRQRIPADASAEDALALKWENHNRTKFQYDFEAALKMAVAPVEINE